MPAFRLFLLLFCTIISTFLVAQKSEINLSEVNFKKAGDVRKMADGCYKLTNDYRWSSGALWYPNPVNLAEDFEMEVEVFLGCKDGGGADGMVFIFSPELSVGYAGEGMGFAGLYPSLGIELDTWQNGHLGDPPQDHIAVLSNGSPNHRYDLAGPILVGKNLEDCKNHLLKVLWKSQQRELLVSVDGVNLVGLQKNIVADIFDQNPRVFWGVSAATGNYSNIHKVCFEKLEFEELEVAPRFDRAKRLALLKGDILPLEEVLFESGKATLKKGSTKELDRLVSLLQENKEMHLGIFGHTDNVGNEKTNETISQKRAESVANYLIAKGIAKERLNAKGMGERFPIASNGNVAGRLKNRRVEVHFFEPYP